MVVRIFCKIQTFINLNGLVRLVSWRVWWIDYNIFFVVKNLLYGEVIPASSKFEGKSPGSEVETTGVMIWTIINRRNSVSFPSICTGDVW